MGFNYAEPMRIPILLLWSLALFSYGAQADMTAPVSDAGAVAVSLDGQWQSALDPKDQGRSAKWFDPAFFPAAEARPIQVPGALTEVWADLKDFPWYLKTFPLGMTPAPGMRYYLRFGAVEHSSDVWFNGTYLGAHEGGEDPFEFDVTSLLQPGKPNTVAVRVKLTTLARWGGLIST